jgi:hypothetical protein
MKAITIHNPMKEAFTWQWNKEDITLAPGESRLMEDWLADHLAYHLADHMLNLDKKPTDHFSRAEVLKRILPEASPFVQEEGEAAFRNRMLNQAQTLTASKEEPIKNKGGRPKGSKNASKAPVEAKTVEAAFEGVNA